jgi:hypothetical protein
VKDPAVYDSRRSRSAAILVIGESRSRRHAVVGDKYDELFRMSPASVIPTSASLPRPRKPQLRADDDITRVMVIGKNAWPCRFHVKTDAGCVRYGSRHDEMIARHIGQNELATIETLRAFVEAQTQYASADRDGDEVLEYAQKVISTEGKKDGLYWQVASADEDVSPFGPFIAELPDYVHDRERGEPYMGYYYRIITRQGDNPPGGRYDYIINGNMIAGFAAIAVPAEYTETGVMTFIISHQGKLYEKDLGDDTALVAAALQDYNPDETWTVVKEE